MAYAAADAVSRLGITMKTASSPHETCASSYNKYSEEAEKILALVREYGAAMRVSGTGPEVSERYLAIVEALRGKCGEMTV